MIAKVSLAVLMTALVIGVAGSSSARAQQKITGGTLTAADYVELQQLVARYSYAVDTHADNGYEYADLSLRPTASLVRHRVAKHWRSLRAPRRRTEADLRSRGTISRT